MKSSIVALAYIALAFAAPVIIEPQGQASSSNAVSSRDEAVESGFDIARNKRQVRSIEIDRREDGAVVSARDGTTEFDADAFYKGRRDDDAIASIVVTARDGTTEFDADAFYTE